MKNVYLFLLTVLLFSNYTCIKAQTWQSNCSGNTYSEMLFRQDINKILVCRLFQNNSTYKDSIQLPTLERDSIARVLYAIYNMPPSAIKDTIMSIFGDSTFNLKWGLGPKQDSTHIYTACQSQGIPVLSTKYISLFAKLTTGGVGAAWKAGNYTNTPDTELNNLIKKYKIKITYKQNIGTNFILEINNLNPFALEKALKKFASIDSASVRSANDYFGSGNKIYLSFDSLGANIEYLLGCGDCPSGCTWGIKWKFSIHSYSDCSVTYSESNYPPLFGISSAYNYCGKPVTTPVDFISFSAQLKENYPSLKWSVANEINIHHYEIEQSQIGKSDFMVADIVSATKGSVNKNYQWQSIKTLLQSTNYRIKAVEQSGKTFYSSILKVNPANTKDWVFIYPNPITNLILQLSINKTQASNYQLVIYSLLGKMVFQKMISSNGEQLSQTVQLPKNIVSGDYSVQLVSPILGRVFQQMITIQ